MSITVKLKYKAIKPLHFGLLFAALTLLFGPLLPLIQNGRFTDRYANIVWDPLYGIGFMIASSMFHELAMSRLVGFIGSIVWPILLFGFLAYSGKKIAGEKWPKHIKVFIVTATFLSFVCNIKIYAAMESSLPFFTVFSAVNF